VNDYGVAVDCGMVDSSGDNAIRGSAIADLSGGLSGFGSAGPSAKR